MSKAEEQALEAYPVFGCEAKDMACGQYDKRETYLEGYHQAEKDLALTWEDLREIVDLCDKLTLEKWHEEEKFTSEEDFYEEVLKRFIERKKV